MREKGKRVRKSIRWGRGDPGRKYRGKKGGLREI